MIIFSEWIDMDVIRSDANLRATARSLVVIPSQTLVWIERGVRCRFLFALEPALSSLVIVGQAVVDITRVSAGGPAHLGVFVLPSHRRRGIGRMLCGRANREFGRMYSSPRSDDGGSSRAFYKAMGVSQ